MKITLDTLVEMVERQIALVEQDNTQNIYKISIKLRLNKARSGDLTQVIDEVRGVEGVTTVSHLTDYYKKGEVYDLVVFDVKYELIGSEQDPVSYLKTTLIPGIRNVQGVDIQNIFGRPEKLN